MSEPFFKLPLKAVWTIDVLLQNMAQDPNYLQGCPYTLEEVEVLEKYAGLLAGKVIEEGEEPEVHDKWGRLEKESNKLFKMLTDFSSKLNEKDNTETMAYFRTATSLLDKIVGIQERTANLKQISRFHDTVLLIMEDILDAGQRTDVLDRLRKSISPEA